MVAALAAYLAWGVLVNDWCDLALDEQSGKRRAILQVPKCQVYGLLVVLPALGFGAIGLSARPDLAVVYFVACVLAAFYSAEPVRLKGRGIHGLWSDALIERSFPALFIVVFFRYFDLSGLFLLALSFVSQVEIILWHQIADYQADMMTRVRTYVVQIGPVLARSVLNSYVRPVSAILTMTAAFVLALKVPVSTILLLCLVPGYVLVQEAVRSRLVTQEDPQRPVYSSYLSICLQGIFPLFLATVLMFTRPQLSFLSAVTFASQYPNIRDYLIGPSKKLLH
jgi:hypothetical protein